jgi:hypothetical protein
MLGINTTTRVVMIVQATIAHIFERRSFTEAMVIMNVLARRGFDPLYCGRQPHDERLFFVVERTARLDELALIALKHVRSTGSHSGVDEIWVSTGYIVRDSTLRDMLLTSRFAMQKRTRDR